MFGLGIHPYFLILLFIIVLIVFGPGKLPEMAGAAGRALREFRKASDDVTSEIRRALDLPEGQANLFTTQGLIEQLTREPETPVATEVAVPFEDETEVGDVSEADVETEVDGARAEGAVGTEETEAGTVGELAKIGTFGPTEIDPGVFASSNDGSPVEGDPFEGVMAAGHDEPSSAVTVPGEELDVVDLELAKPPDPVDEVEEADGEPAAQGTDANQPAPSASVEDPASPEETSPQPAAEVENPPESEEDGGGKTGEGAA